MFADLAIDIVIFLAAAAFVAGFVDSIAGGGGLITVPALLLAGFPPVAALGTNKLQGLFGQVAAMIAYAAKGHVDLRALLPAASISFFGAVIGAIVATVTPGEWLRAALPPMLVAIALYFAFKRDLDDTDRARRLSPFLFGFAVVPAIGFYDGLFGPGAGSFFMLAYVTLAGYGVLKAIAHTKVLNFASNLGAFVALALAGAVSWQAGLLMGVCSYAGARLGAALAIRKGARLIKPLLVVTCLALALRLLTQ